MNEPHRAHVWATVSRARKALAVVDALVLSNTKGDADGEGKFVSA